ncbi:MAG: thymidine kinase [Phycisphaerales bacterium JB043]
MDAPNPRPPARLSVICGPMFSGKTTALIERLIEHRKGGRDVIAVKPRLDDRYHPTDLTTHTGVSLPARTIDVPDNLDEIHADLIGLDECHFFETGLHDAVQRLLHRGTDVILAGLDRTSLNEPFAEMGHLLVEADEIVKLTSPCAICAQPAVHTIRLFDSDAPIVVGGEGMFENRCRLHLHDPPPRIRPDEELPPDLVR